MLWLAGMLLLLGFPGLMLVIIGLCGLFGQIFRPLERIYPMLLRIFGIYVACYGVFLFAMMIWGLLTETEDRLGFTILVPICAGIVLVGRTIYHKGKELAEQERRNEFFRSKASK